MPVIATATGCIYIRLFIFRNKIKSLYVQCFALVGHIFTHKVGKVVEKIWPFERTRLEDDEWKRVWTSADGGAR